MDTTITPSGTLEYRGRMFTISLLFDEERGGWSTNIAEIIHFGVPGYTADSTASWDGNDLIYSNIADAWHDAIEAIVDTVDDPEEWDGDEEQYPPHVRSSILPGPGVTP